MPEGPRQRRKVLLVGWDAADWKVVRPLMDAGKMPNVQRLVREGCTSPIATLQPSFSPMLWTSIATGKRPFDHGIHGFSEPRSDGRGVQRVTNLARKCKALWNILGQSGLESIVVGWWPSYPVEPIRGAMVSDQFHRVSRDFKLVAGMVHPPEFGEDLAALRLNPEELPLDLLEFFAPNASRVDQECDKRLLSAARVISECVNIHTAATWLMDRAAWDFCAVYFDAVDHFGHGFMKFNPPRRDDVSEQDFANYQGVLQAGYQLHDRMLGTLIEKAGDDATVILMSDHGFHPDHLRPSVIPQAHAGPALEHRNNGVFAIAGPGIRRGAEVPGVSLLDVTPTVLSLFGLPAGDDMEGRTLAGVFEQPPRIARIPTWEKVDGDDGRHPPHMQIDPMAAAESVEQLVALGYVDEPDEDHEKAVKSTLTDLRVNLAEAFQDAGRHAEAADILRELRAEDPDDQRIATRLFISAVALGRRDEMATIAEDWSGRRQSLYVRAAERANELRQLARSRATSVSDTNQALLDDSERAELKSLKRVWRFDTSLAEYFTAQVYRARRRWAEALRCTERIPATDLIRPGLWTDRAELLGRLGRWEDAAAAVRDGLTADSTDARLHFVLCRIRLHHRDWEGAVSAALDGLALLNLEPRGHYLLGLALCRIGNYEAAIAAFEQALRVNPDFPQALLWLLRIFRKCLPNPQEAGRISLLYIARQKNLHGSAKSALRHEIVVAPRALAFSGSARDLPPLKNEIVVVSGLPRSGTSMLMQMLVAGGLEVLIDGIRQADEDNPRGYFEFEPVKQMSVAGAPWMEQARGKAVKIVAPMIAELPDNLECRVILIERDINEIIASQRQMIARRKREVPNTPARLERLKQEYLRLVIWTKGYLAGRPGTKLLCVNRTSIICNAPGAAAAINRFLGGGLDEIQMAAAVKPELDRQRSGSPRER